MLDHPTSKVIIVSCPQNTSIIDGTIYVKRERFYSRNIEKKAGRTTENNEKKMP